MKKHALMAVAALFMTMSGAMAQPETPAPAVKFAMEKVAWLTGEWLEKGIYCRADQCYPSLEMRLTKVDRPQGK